MIIDLSDDEEDVALKKTAAKAEAVSSSSRAGASSSGAGAGGSQRNGSRKGFSGVSIQSGQGTIRLPLEY